MAIRWCWGVPLLVDYETPDKRLSANRPLAPELPLNIFSVEPGSGQTRLCSGRPGGTAVVVPERIPFPRTETPLSRRLAA
jgi:hypothetical protein